MRDSLVRKGRPGSWIRRLAEWVLTPFSLPAQLRQETLARRQLAEDLENRRDKDQKIRLRMAQLEAERDAHAEDAHAMFETLTAESRKVRLDDACALPWTEASARANRQAHARGAVLDRAVGVRASAAGGLAGPLPPFQPIKPHLVRVAIAGRAPTAFSFLSDPRVISRHVGDPLVLEADGLVFPHAEDREYRADAKQVPAPMWERVRRGLTTVVFDASSEGVPHADRDTRELHAFLAEHGAAPSAALYVTQDRRYEADYRGWCAAEGLEPMRVWVFDSYLYRVLREFHHIGAKVFQLRLAQYVRRPAVRERRFVCLNYTLRPLKILFLLGLMRDGLWERGWISSGGFAAQEDEDGFSRHALTKRLLATEGFQDEVEALAPFMDRLEAAGSQLLTVDDDRAGGRRRSRILRAGDLEAYRDSWFTIVTETEMSPRVHRITEKPLKPLLAFHPFVVLGNPGSLALLRGYGFESFAPVFDERYDQELDPRRRFDMVSAETRRLCALDEADMARVSAELDEIVTFNACWGLTELPRRFNDTVVADLVDQLPPRAAST